MTKEKSSLNNKDKKEEDNGPVLRHSRMSEKLCLQWNDFKENITALFGNLRHDEDFVDVTLVCEDGKQVEAHKVILASSSPVFQRILKINKHERDEIRRSFVYS